MTSGTARLPVSWLTPKRVLIGAVALAAVLRAFGTASIPLWTDELFTLNYPRLGLGYLWSTGLHTEPTSPLYYSLIWAIERAGGTDAAWLRAPSVIAGVATVALVAQLARTLSPARWAPALAALLVALSPSQIFLAEDARAYALQNMALAVALLGFARVLIVGRGLVLYGVAAVAAIWLHPTSIFAVAAINGAALSAMVGRAPPLAGRTAWRWVGTQVVVALACLPLLPVLTSGGAASATSWIPALSRWSLEAVIGTALAGPALSDHALRICEVAVALLLALFLLPPWRPGRRALTVLAVAPLLFLGLMVAASVTHPVLLSRTVAWLLLPLAVALADVLLRRNRFLLGATLTAVALTTVLHFRDLDRLKENWRDFLAQLPDLGPPALIVLAPHTSPGALALYAPGAATPVRLDDGGPPVPETVVTEQVFGTETIDVAQMARAIAEGRPVWLIYRRPEYAWMKEATAALPPPRASVQDQPGSNPGIKALRW